MTEVCSGPRGVAHRQYRSCARQATRQITVTQARYEFEIAKLRSQVRAPWRASNARTSTRFLQDECAETQRGDDSSRDGC